MKPVRWMLIALFALPLAVFAAGAFWPQGLLLDAAARQEGLLILPESGWTNARFEPRANIERNLHQRGQGRYTVDDRCVDAGPLQATLDHVLHQPRPHRGDRALWISVMAETRWRPSPCMQRLAHRGRGAVHYGRHLRILSVERATPIRCNIDLFVRNGRSCPPPSAPPAALHLDRPDLYPQAARQAGVEGEAQVELLVGPGNAIARCRILRSSGHADLDAAACPTATANPQALQGKGSAAGLATGMRRLIRTVCWQLKEQHQTR